MKKTRVVGQESDQVPNVEVIASCSNLNAALLCNNLNLILGNVYYLSVCVRSEILVNKHFHLQIMKHSRKT